MSSPTDEHPLVSIEDVDVHFETSSGFFGSSTVQAVNGVSLDIREDDVIALIGESGCGKTTLGKTAIGIQRPTNGSIKYRGQDIWDAKDGTGDIDITFERIRRALQIIHQDPESSLNPNRSVLANLSVPLKKYRPDMGPGAREQVVHKLLYKLGIEPPEDYAERFPHQLSGGEAQRVALGRSLLMQPDLILADEAVSALDVSLRVEMMDLLLSLREMFNTALLVISHDFANARYLTKKADGRVGVMYLGDLVEIGPVDEVLQNPKHPYTKVLVWSSPPMHPDDAEKATEEDPPVRSIDIPDPENPPTGCRFHTRCEKIIPPQGMDIEQETYNEIVDFRIDIADQSLDTEEVWISLDVDPEEASAEEREPHVEEFVTALREQYFDVTLSSPHDERINDALELIAAGEWDEAGDLLREHYESICERKQPTLQGEHPVACHLYDESDEPEPQELTSD